VHSSRHRNMKESRIQHAGRPYRVLFAFDPQAARDAAGRWRQNGQHPLV
jgi:hypothetical protein